MADYALYLVAKFFSALLMLLPAKCVLGIGGSFGRLAYFVNYKRAKVAYSNMRAAFCEEKTASEIRIIVKRLYRNFGATLAEVLRMPKIDSSYMEKYVRIENMEYITRSPEEGRGLIFLTGHFGNWELSSIVSALAGYPLLVLAREQKLKRLNEALNGLRESTGSKVIKKGIATREIYEHLRNNGIVGILSDQDAGKKGIFVNFFGRPTSTPRGAFTLARKTGATIIPTFMIRNKDLHYTLMVESPIVVARDGSGELRAMQKFASVLEKYIRMYPEQWLWLHKRWKSTPLRKVIILSDGKTGHLNQSRAVFDKIRACRREAGYRDDDTELKIIEVQYRTRGHKILLALLSNLVSGYALLRMKSLKLCLREDSYMKLEKSYADIIISCGSVTAPVNAIFSKENNAKNAVIMKPGLVSSGNFDLAIIPEYDNPPRNRNITTTFGSPNLITPKKLEDDLRSLERVVDLQGKRSIGVLLGGENKNYTLDEVVLKGVMEDVIEAARKLNANILLTTSRRTGPDVDNYAKELNRTGLAKLIVIANESNPEWTVGGILGAADVIVVSGESSSMLSEAASSGKHVVVFRPRKKPTAPRNDKHELFLDSLSSRGIIRISEAGRIREDILELVNSSEKPKRIDDNKKLEEAVKRII